VNRRGTEGKSRGWGSHGGGPVVVSLSLLKHEPAHVKAMGSNQ